jgi:hypothetical protein
LVWSTASAAPAQRREARITKKTARFMAFTP